jgi:hypothetical protein
MNPSVQPVTIDLTPSVYYGESLVRCKIDYAWKVMLDYQAWNPTFVGAEVMPVRGDYRTEGELVLIKKSLSDVHGEPLPQFYAETIKVVPRRNIVWFVYPVEGDDFRNFVDFGLLEGPAGVTFRIDYYAQNRLSGDLLLKERTQSQATLQHTADAFKEYCETHA